MKGILLGILVFTILIAGVSAQTTQDYVVIYKDDVNLGRVKIVIEETNFLKSILDNLFLSFKDTRINIGDSVDIVDSVIKVGCTSSTVPYKSWEISVLKNNQVVNSWDVTDMWDKLSGCEFKVTAFFVPGSAGLYKLKESTTSSSGSISSHTGTNELEVIDPDAEDDCVWSSWKLYQDISNGKKYVRTNPCEDSMYKIDCNTYYVETNGACVLTKLTPCGDLLENPCKLRTDCSWNTAGINKCEIKGSGGTGGTQGLLPVGEVCYRDNECVTLDCGLSHWYSKDNTCQPSSGGTTQTGCESLDKVTCQADYDCEWDTSCKTKSIATDENARQISLTYTEIDTATSQALLKSSCTLPEQCDLNKCESLQSLVEKDVITDIQAIDISKKVSGELKKAIGSIGAGATAGTVCVALLAGGVTIPVAVPACLVTGGIAAFGIWDLVTSIDAGNKEKLGLCIKKEGGGFCWSFADSLLNKFTKTNDCQTNTIIFVIVVFMLMMIVMKMMNQ